MAKAVKCVAARKKSPKRRTTGVVAKTAAKRPTPKKTAAKAKRLAAGATRPARKKTARRAAPKKAASKVRRVAASTTKSARKKTTKRTISKKATSNVRRKVTSASKPVAKKKRSIRTAARKTPRQATEMQLETTIIDVIEEPVPGVVVVTEYEVVRPMPPTSSEGEPEAGEGAGPETAE